MNIRGKVAIVTGAGKRVGRTVAIALAQKGADVAAHYLSSRAAAMDTAREIRRLGGRGECFRADLSRVVEARELAHAVEKKLGGIDILVNSASIYEPVEWDHAKQRDWDRHLNTNARGPFFLAQAAALSMRKRGCGKIVNIIDSSVHRPYPKYSAYLISKMALLGVTYCLAKELAPEIQVNAVSPGAVLLPPDWDDKTRKAIIKATPLKKIGSPEDIAQAVLFLVENSNFITGVDFPVDGGRRLF